MIFTPSRIKMRNMFSPNSSEDKVGKPYQGIFGKNALMPDPVEEETKTKKPADVLMDMFNEPNPSTDRYNDYLANQPSESDYEPSRKRKLAGALLAGIASINDPQNTFARANKFINDPKEQALADWERKRIPLHDAAMAETQGRTAKINILKDYIQAQHQNTMDDATLANIKHDNELGDRTLQNTQDWQVTQAGQRDAENLRVEKNRLADNARADKLAAETGRHNLETEKVARTNSQTSASRADTYKLAQEGLTNYRDHLLTKMASTTDTPAKQKTAQEAAQYNVFLKPGNSMKYDSFFSRLDNGKIVIVPPKKGFFTSDDEYNSAVVDYMGLKKEIDDESNRILGSKTPTTSTAVKPPDKPKTKIIGREKI